MNKKQSKKALQISAILFKNNVPVDEAKVIGAFIEELIQENEILDKKINQYIEQRDEWISLLNMFKKQQKEFIEYLEEPIKIITEGNPTNISEYTIGKLDTLKEVLKKYKEIIGVEDGEN